MSKYYGQKFLLSDYRFDPPKEPLVGTMPLKRARVASVMRAQDANVYANRRILIAKTLRGVSEWQVPNSNPDGAAKTHPDATTARVVWYGKADLTPGCALYVEALCALSGETQKFIGAGNYDADGAQGTLQVVITWYDVDGANVTTTYNVSTKPSVLQYGAESNLEDGQIWQTVYPVRAGPFLPEPFDTGTDARRWCRQPTAEITIKHKGSPRIVSCVISEAPHSFAMEADDAPAYWTQHLFASGSPHGLQPSMEWPLKRLSETSPDGNPRAGSYQTLDVAAAQNLRFGPCLISWTPYTEFDAEPDDSDIDVFSTGSTTYVGVLDSSLTSYDEDAPGWVVSCGSYALQRKMAHPISMRHDGAIPVRVRVLATGTGTVRLQSCNYDSIDVGVSSGGYAWTSTYGWMRCGYGIGDLAIAQAFYKAAPASSVALKAIQVHYAGQYVSADPT